jgi:hypothetical protein
MSQGHEVKQSLDEVKTRLAPLETASGVEAAWGLLQRVLRSSERLLSTLVEAPSTLQRLQALVFGQRRRRHHTSGAGASEADGSEAEAGRAGGGETGGRDAQSGADTRLGSGVGVSDEAVKATRSGGHRPGDGRLEAEAYRGAARVGCRHEE